MRKVKSLVNLLSTQGNQGMPYPSAAESLDLCLMP